MAKKKPRDTRRGRKGLAVYRRDGWLCRICSERIEQDLIRSNHLMGATLDHIIPRCYGGPDAQWNLRATHKLCNNKRPDRIREADVLDIAINITSGQLMWGSDYQQRRQMARLLVQAYEEYKVLLDREKATGQEILEEEVPELVAAIKANSIRGQEGMEGLFNAA